LRAIFISYRRSDSQGEAGRLFDDLIKLFGRDLVFMDVAAIDAGRDFRKAIDESLANCGVLLAMIGPEWLSATNDSGARRLDDATDFIRIETAAALRRDIPVIPVLVRGAKMPRAEQLPGDIADLSYRNGVELTHVRWKSDVQLLIKALRPLIGDEKGPLTGAPRKAGDATPHRAGASQMDPGVVQLMVQELANYIGPIAEIVVKRAATNCNSLEELGIAVAREIDSQAEREKFLASIRR
jgi:hypothetical protein